jgi:hypothetical protein
MACTCTSCGTGYSGSCCPTCQPANSIYQGECADPGTLTIGRHLTVLDYKFCERRLTNASGLLVANVNGSGNFGIGFSTTPQVQLSEYEATEDTSFGNLIVMGSDYRWRFLSGPASLGLFLQTDANGMLFFGDPPTATIPDPLAINDLSVANEATINDLTTSGTLTLNNLAAGTVVNLIGLNASAEVVLQALTAGIAASMFYESATSPGVGAPNKAKTTGQYLIIGNRLFDSGANLISVTTSEALTVNVAGKYLLLWQSEIRMLNNGKGGAWLEVNGVIVNPGTGRTDAEIGNALAANTAGFTGMEVRSLAVNDVLKLKLSLSATGTTFEARLIAIKFAD